MALKFLERRKMKQMQELPPEAYQQGYSSYPDPRDLEMMGRAEAGPVEPIPESSVELQTFLVRPDAGKQFKHIHKDLTLSNLNEGEIWAIRNHGDCIGLFDHFGLNGAKKVFLHDAFFILNSARSRRGFERRMVATHIFKQISEREKAKKKRWSFG